ncbi:hypothetical protein K491DRAFT_678706 [Lophiostoma macrostomum CBS 122681]|uniref:CFEM domain-containing protein n=1 Tax=Lophiostoma macrostomum CBS 122681 TaxID=1314788 RepID=A0A6A6T7A1_9PLEO|nr:hypothetical protein K491DRAFT_678706 [Lophiostoma macrostomum CBS 122681]
MKSFTLLLALAAIATSWSIAELPSCSMLCLQEGLEEVQCSIADYKCSCSKAEQLLPIVGPCVQNACSAPEDQQKVSDVLAGICEDVGLPITIAVREPVSSAPGYGQASSTENLSTMQVTKFPITDKPTPASTPPCPGTPTPTPTPYPTPTPIPVRPSTSSSEPCINTITHTITISKPVPSCSGAPDCPLASTSTKPACPGAPECPPHSSSSQPGSSVPPSSPSLSTPSPPPSTPTPITSTPVPSESTSGTHCLGPGTSSGYCPPPPPPSVSPSPSPSSSGPSTLTTSPSYTTKSPSPPPPYPTTSIPPPISASSSVPPPISGSIPVSSSIPGTGSSSIPASKPPCPGTDKCPPVTPTGTHTSTGTPPPYTGAAVMGRKVEVGLGVAGVLGGLAVWL